LEWNSHLRDCIQTGLKEKTDLFDDLKGKKWERPSQMRKGAGEKRHVRGRVVSSSQKRQAEGVSKPQPPDFWTPALVQGNLLGCDPGERGPADIRF